MPTPQATTLDLGRAVRRLRNARGLTIEALADASGMDRTYLQKLEVKGRNLSWEKIAGLASGLETTIGDLVAHAELEANIIGAGSPTPADPPLV
ncbi:MAG TPA: helix-turn-helix transcriptional regulator [Solirubrobacteraceae bacterium]|nr:helix-turn-helix transcriptional regulator [Solirubrobacteraceae bacterium]